MKRHFILNPNAGRTGEAKVDELRTFFGPGSVFHFCHSSEEATAQSRTALLLGAEVVVAVGGDGTVNSVMNGFFEGDSLIRPNAALGFANAGTGSDYCRSVLEGARWTETLRSGTQVEVDVGVVSDGQRTKKFLNMASLGLTALIVERIEAPPRIPLPLAYPLATVAELFARKTYDVQIESEGGVTLMPKLLAMFIAKGEFMAGGMRTGTEGLLTDGLLQAIAVPNLEWMNLLTALPSLYRGGVGTLPAARRFRLPELRVKCAGGGIPCEIDGDSWGSGEFHFRVLPSILKICVPAI